MLEHLAEDSALFVLALADDDPDKRAAMAHARECSSCQRLLEEGRSLLELFDADAAASQVPIDPAFEARVRAAVFPSASPLRARVAKLGLLLGGLASLLMLALEADVARPLHFEIGVHCLVFEQLVALASLAAGFAVGRRYLSEFGPWQSALSAMSGALVAQWLLQWGCEAEGAAVHLLLFHAGGVLIASVLGAFAGRLAPAQP